jgi:3-hydroxybutyryl-CoA dehydrogenase
MGKSQISKIAIIGGGVMGSSIALNLAYFDINVILIDINDEALGRAKESIARDLKMMRFLLSDLKDVPETKVRELINYSTNLEDAADTEFVIESISEDLQKKQNLYTSLNDITSKKTIYASNTSCIPITNIGSWVENPDRVVGIHFMNPAVLKNTVEVIQGFHTSVETIEAIKSFLKSINKHPVIVNDSPGFVANRLSHLFMNEAAFLVQENVAHPKDIDMIFKKGYGHAMGPLETADLIGLDTVVQSLKILYDSFQDQKFRCCPLLTKMVHAGRLGKKSGEGFFKYNN